MQYLISVIDDTAGQASRDEIAAVGNPEPESPRLTRSTTGW